MPRESFINRGVKRAVERLLRRQCGYSDAQMRSDPAVAAQFDQWVNVIAQEIEYERTMDFLGSIDYEKLGSYNHGGFVKPLREGTNNAA